MTTRIGMMMGDPAGVGAELTARVLAGGSMSAETGAVIVGDPAHLARGAITATVMSALVAVLTIFVFVMWPEPLINLFMQRDEPARDQILVIGVGLLAMASLEVRQPCKAGTAVLRPSEVT